MKLLLTNDYLDINLTYKSEKNKNIQTIIEMTLIQFAIENNHNEIIHQILSQSNKIDINKLSIKSMIGKEIEIYEKTTLYMCIEKQNINAIKSLLSRTDIDVNGKSFYFLGSKTIKAKTALHLAVEMEDLEIIKLLLERKEIDIHIEDVEGKTPIDYAKNDEIKQLLS